MTLLRLIIATACLATPAGAVAQVSVSTEPAVLVRGRLFRMSVALAADDSIAALTGEVAGEPLHFERRSVGAWSAIAGTPVDGGDSIMVRLYRMRVSGRWDSVDVRLDVAQTEGELEQLKVAPRMARPGKAAEVRIAKDNAKAREVSRKAHRPPRLWNEPFITPRESRITSAFGTGRTFNGKTESRHLGTDFDGAVGDPVRAANRGVVALVTHFYLAGRVIYLYHGAGLLTAYFHLSKAVVSVGDTVERGQLIGRVGRSGRVTGPHLHWTARYGTIAVDPMSLPELGAP